MEVTQGRIFNLPRKKDRTICISRKSFRATYADNIILSKQLATKQKSKVNWLSVLNSTLTPILVIWMAIECCL